MTLLELERARARTAIVDEHIRCENRHDLDATMATFGVIARYDDEPWGDHRTGRDGVRAYYTELMRALPDLVIEVKHRHVASEGVVVEVTIRGAHLVRPRNGPRPARALPRAHARVGAPCHRPQSSADDRACVPAPLLCRATARDLTAGSTSCGTEPVSVAARGLSWSVLAAEAAEMPA